MARLLIVDDEQDVRDFAANFFRKRKIDVDTAANGQEAIDKVERVKMDLVLLDIKMDGMDGIETLKRLKDLDKDMKVIMVTGRKPDDDDSLAQCQQLGAIDYIHKPLELAQLEQVVLKALHKTKRQ